MSLDNSIHRLTAMIAELDKAATAALAAPKTPKTDQIDLFASPAPAARTASVENTLMASTLDRTIERIETLLQTGTR